MFDIASHTQGDAGGLDFATLVADGKVEGGLAEIFPIGRRGFATGLKNLFVVVEA